MLAQGVDRGRDHAASLRWTSARLCRRGKAMKKMTGAAVLTSILEQAGISVVAGIPGHTVGDFALAVGANPSFKSILVRHEATATFAADVYFRVSGRLMAPFT